MSGHFRLDVDAAGVRSAAENIRRVVRAVGADTDRLRGLLPGLSASFVGQAAQALETEATHLADEMGRAETFLGDGARVLTTLAERYDLALDVEVPELNRRWQAAVDAHAEAVRASDAQLTEDLRTAAPTSLVATGVVATATAPTGGTDPGQAAAFTAAAASRVATATATMAAEQRRIQQDFDDLREQLRAATRTAGNALARSTVVPVSAAAVASYTRGGFFGAVSRLFTSMPDAAAAFANSLTLTALRQAQKKSPGPGAGSEALRQLLDTARGLGLHPTEYANLLQDYYRALAFERAGIDPATWDPEAGARANEDIVFAVYRYYGNLFLNHPELQWAGMANMIGPSFAAGFFDIDGVRRFADRVAGIPGAAMALPPGSMDALRALAGATEAEVRFFETTFLSMQKEIFLDQAPMHEAYLLSGMPAIREMADAGLIDSGTVRSWAQIDAGTRSGDQALVAAGNTGLLRREQFDIIADDYDRMRNHHGPVGQGFTYTMTFIGAPSIPAARSYAEFDPLRVTLESPGPERFGTPDHIGTPDRIGPFDIPHVGVDIPHISVDNPAQVEAVVSTPLPGGNISQRDERWALVTQDTLPAYQHLLATDPEQARHLVATPVPERVEEYRLLNQTDEILRRLGNWDAEVRQ